MKYYTEQEIRNFMKTKAIVLDGQDLILDDSTIDKEVLIASLKKLQTNSKDKNIQVEQEDFSEYSKGSGQKTKSKIRKK